MWLTWGLRHLIWGVGIPSALHSSSTELPTRASIGLSICLLIPIKPRSWVWCEDGSTASIVGVLGKIYEFWIRKMLSNFTYKMKLITTHHLFTISLCYLLCWFSETKYRGKSDMQDSKRLLVSSYTSWFG